MRVKFKLKHSIIYQSKLYSGGEVIEVDQKDVTGMLKYGEVISEVVDVSESDQSEEVKPKKTGRPRKAVAE